MNQNFSSFENSQPEKDQEIHFAQVKNASYFRARARRALKPCIGLAVLAFFLASLLGGVTWGEFAVSFSTNSSETEVSAPMPDETTQLLQNGDWGSVVDSLPTVAILILIVGAFFAAVGILLSIFVSSPVKLGYQRFNLDLIDSNNPSIGTLFDYFKKGYLKSIGVSLFYALWNFLICLPAMIVMVFVFAPAILHIITSLPAEATMEDYQRIAAEVVLPSLITFAVGVVTVVAEMIFQYTYGYCYMILAEYPEMGVIDAFRSSRTMMRGRKWKLFCLDLSFIGWMILTVLAGMLTCGIGSLVGMLFLNPYMQAAKAAFYDDAANREAAREAVFPSLNPDDYTPDANAEEQV
ncbi:MAG: DUF975 family protein [Clostridia bacterium]|nr:DUF975 family protein [Clostridia bacterium]